MPTPQGRYWCWTLNNPTEAEKEHLSLVQILNNQIQYLVYQLEQGEQRTPHLQGYVEFSSRVTRNQAKTLISQRCHIERRRGTGQEARQYCQKEDGRLDGPWEFGEFTETTSSRGSRTDLETIRRLIASGSSEKCIADEFFSQWCQYNTSFRKYREYVSITVIGRRMSSSSWVRLAQESPDGLWTTIRQRTGSRDQYGGTTMNATNT